jgi:hypothetical protein
MVKRRTSKARVIYRNPKRAYRRSRKNPNSELNQLIGTGLFAATESGLESVFGNMLTSMNLNVPVNLVEAGIGYKLKNKRGITGHFGKAMYNVQIYQLLKGIVGNQLNLGNLFKGSTTTNTNSQPGNVFGF